jgi:hypothetical protein
MLVGWRDLRLDLRQKPALLSAVFALFQPTRTASSPFRILTVPKNGGPGGFDSLGRSASFDYREDEAILKRDQPPR